MKNKLLTIGFAMISLAMIVIPVAMPSAAFAASNSINSKVFFPTILAGPLLVCVGSPTSNVGGNSLPVCSNLCDLVAQIANIIYYMIGVVIWIIVPILVAVGGIMIMLGGANPGMIEKGKSTITGAVWGLVIVLCAWLIVYTFVGAFGNLGKYVGGFPGGPAACTPPASTTSGASLTAPNACGGSNPGYCPTGQQCVVVSGLIGVMGASSTATYGCQ